MENEAQLAASLGDSIAHIIEKEDFLHHTRLHDEKYARLALGVSPSPVPILGVPFAMNLAKLILEINERCDRVALTYMVQQGYDLREAALSQLKPDGTSVNNPFGPDETPPPRMVKLMQELQLDYASADYANLKQNREGFVDIRLKAQAAAK